MSKTIDERVVSMQFDNKQFESNVRTSMSTLEKLKRSLNLTGAAKGLDNINAAAKNCNLSPLSNAAETVKVKFSALEVMAVTAIANITNSAVNAGKRLVSSLTIDQVTAGWTKYEQKTSSVQTIMNATGKSIDEVNGYLDKLMWYSDETSYGFTDMTQSLAQLTSAGGNIDKLIPMIEGIANATAFAGKGASEFSRAIYNLNQSYSAGYLQYMDWKSLDLAGVSSKQLKQVFIDTAIALGKLDKNGKTAKGTLVEIGNFGQTLSEKWADTEVMEAAFGKFAELTDAAYEAVKNGEYDTASEAIEALAGSYDEIAGKAFKSAQEAKTFNEAIEATKDAVSSGWMKTAEIIFGNYEEAKVLWTDLANTLWDVFASGSESRNEMLEGAMTNNWDKMIKKINEAGISSEKFEETLRATLKGQGYNVDNWIEKYGSLEEAFRSGAISSNILKKAVKSLEGSLVDLSGVEAGLKKGSQGDDVKKVQKALKDLGYDLGKWDVDGIIGSKTEEAIKKFQEAKGLKITGIVDEETLKALEEASGKVEGLSESVKDLISGITELGGRELLIESFKNIWEALVKPINTVKEAWRDVFPPMTSEKLYKIIEGLNSFSEKLIMSDDNAKKIKRTFKGLFALLDVVRTFIGGGVSVAFKLLSKVLGAFDLNILDVTASIGDALAKFRDWIFENDRLNAIFDKLASGIVKVVTGIRDWIKAFVKLPKVQNYIYKFKNGFIDAFKNIKKLFGDGIKGIKKFIDNLKSMDSFSFDNIKKLFVNFKDKILKYFSTFKNPFSAISEALKSFRDDAKKYLEEAGIKFDEIKEKISNFVKTVKEVIGDKMGSILAIGFLIGFILLIKKITNTFGLIGEAVSGIVDAIKNFGVNIQNFIDGLGDVFKSFARKANSEALLNIAKAIALLAGSIFLLTQLDQGKMWSSIGALGALAGGLVLISYIISKFKITDFGKISMGLIGMATAMLIMSWAAKNVANMDATQLAKAGGAIAVFLAIIVTISKISSGVGNDISNFGKMMLKLSAALLILTIVIRILGGMDTDKLVKGGLALTYLLGLMVGMMASTKLLAKDIPKFGSMMLGLGASLLLMSSAVRILGGMDTGKLVKGTISIGVFLGMIALMMKSTNLLAKDLPKFGATMFGIGAALLMMSGSVAILGSMKEETIKKGMTVILGFTGIVIALMAATKLMGRHSYNAGKFGLLLLSFAASITLLTGSIILLSLISGERLKRAMAAMTGIGIILAGLVSVTKIARSVKMGTIIGLSVAIAIMAASIAALSLIDKDKLIRASAALSAVVGMVALLIASTKFVTTKSLIALGIISLVVGGIAYILHMLVENTTDADKALKVSEAISILIVSLSASCALLGVASKFGPKSLKGLLILTGMVGLVAGLAALAIWQLPNIATQLSKFMENLKPFLDGAKGIKPEVVESLKILGQAMLMFTGAGAIHAAFNALTFGGVSRAFASFASFIKEVVPVVKDLALEVSGDGIRINTANLNAVIGAVAGLAEASGKVPSTKVVGAIGGGKGIFGLAGAVSVPQLKEFTSWMKEVIPAIKDLALSLSGEDVEINGEAIISVCEGVKVLAEAANAAPGITIAGGGGGGKGFGAGFLAISIPQLDSFKTWLEGATGVMSDFAGNIKESAITSEDADALISICEGVKVLSAAAKEAPGIEAGVGFAKFAGGFGLFAGASVPLLDKFKSWLEEVIPVMTDFAVTISESKITADDTDNLVSICEGVKVLGEAAKAAPGIEAGLGFAKFAGGFGLFAGASVPLLGMFTSWLEKVIPVMTDFTVAISESKITADDADNLVSICEGVKVLGEAAKAAPGIEAGLGIVKFAGGFGLLGGFSVPLLDKFKSWLEEVIPVMTDFSVTISESKIKSSDTENLISICEGVKALGEAAKAGAGGVKGILGVVVAGPVMAAFAGVEVTNLSSFKDWIVEVAPVMSDFATGITKSNLTESDAENIKSICEAVKILAEAVQVGATTTEIINAVSLLGAYSSITITDIEGFRDFLTGGEDGEGVVSVMNDLATNIGTLEFTAEDGEKIKQLCEAVKILGEAAHLAPTKEEIDGWFSDKTITTDLDGFKSWIEEMITTLNDIGAKLAESNTQIDTGKLLSLSKSAKLLSEGIEAFSSALNVEIFQPELFSEAASGVADAMVDFSKKVAEINHTALASAAGAARDIAETFSIATSYGSDYSSVDTVAFKTKAIELGDAIKEFSSTMEGVNVSFATYQVNSLAATISGLSSSDFSGAEELAKAIKTLGETSIDDLISAFSNSDKLISVGSSIISNLASGITDNAGNITAALSDALATAAVGIADSAESFSIAGSNLIDSFASGISSNDTAKTSVTTIASGAAEGARSTDIWLRFYNAGGYVVSGFASGIALKTYIAKSAAKAMARAAANAAKQELNINSPSKVFRKIGYSVPEGFAQGIDRLVGLVKHSAINMGDAAIKGTSKAISRITDAINSDIDVQPTIRPVLDLSDVESGAGTINGIFGMTPSIRTLSNVGAISSMMNRSQNGANSDVISAIENLGKQMGKTSGDTYQINGVTYDDGSNITDAVKTIVRAARIERRR